MRAGGAEEMFLDVKDLAVRKLPIHKRYAPGSIDYHTSEIKQVEPLEVNATAELFDGEIRISGRLETKVELSCARCLEPVVEEVSRDFDLSYAPLPKQTKRRAAARRHAARAGAAGAAHEGYLPKRLPGAMRKLRRKPEPRRMPL